MYLNKKFTLSLTSDTVELFNIYLFRLNFSEFYVYRTPDQGVMKQFKTVFIMQSEQPLQYFLINL